MKDISPINIAAVNQSKGITVINPRRYLFPQLQLEGVVLFRLRHLKNR